MTQDQLRRIFQSNYSHQNWHDLLRFIFEGSQKPCQLRLLEAPSRIPVPNEDRMEGRHIGNVSFGSETLQLYVFELKDNTQIRRNRIGLRNTVNYLRDMDDAALVVYYNNDEWRVSYISDAIGGKARKRFSFAFGNDQELYKTPIQRFVKLEENELTFKAIEDCFGVEALNKDFFKGYKDLFRKFTAELSKGRIETKQDRDYVKKLLGRLVFLQFLQKKGWMGVPAAHAGWEGGDPNYLQNLVANNKTDRLLTEVLEPLFFTTLNKKRDGDIADPKLGNNIKIPYLNGGLFDNDTLDDQKIDFPHTYFKELADFFSAYNFTIDENDPDDSEVGIDPEMLGHIFENLLEDNKDKGAFYTPKEIVHYMCRESLVKYLYGHTDKSKHEAIDKLVHDGYFTGTVPDAIRLNQLLKEVKICDPAIGSGAFPMGLLAEILHCRSILLAGQKTFPSSAAIKREIIQENIYGVDLEQGAVDIARLRFWLSLVVDEPQPEPLPNLDYKIMQGNSLLESYAGLPLDKIGEIHKKYTYTDLFSLDTEINFSEDIDSLMDDYFGTTDHTLKANLRNRIESQVKERIGYSIDKQLKDKSDAIEALKRQLTDNSPQSKHKAIETLEKDLVELRQKVTELQHINEGNRPYFLWHTYFKDVFDKGGFDIIIGNPPYIQLQKNGGELSKLFGPRKEGKITISSPYKTFDSMGDIYSLFYECGYNILRPGGTLCFITSNKWMRAGYGENTRKFFVEHTDPVLLVDLGAGIFESATVDTNILMFTKDKNRQQTQACTLQKGSLKDLSVYIRQSSTVCSFGVDSWVVLSPIEQSIKAKIEAVGTPLRDWDVQINYGIKTGFNDAFVISGEKRQELITQDPKSEEIIRPILRGRDIKRYGYNFADLWLINTHNGIKEKGVKPININDYPAIKKHLDDYWKQIEKRADQGDTPYNLRNCAYIEDFYKQKIVWKAVGRNLAFSLLEPGSFLAAPASFITSGNNSFLLGVLCSSYAKYFIYNNSDTTGAGDIMLNIQSLAKLPIPTLSDEKQTVFCEIVNQIIELKQNGETTLFHERELDRMIYAIFDFNMEEIGALENL